MPQNANIVKTRGVIASAIDRLVTFFYLAKKVQNYSIYIRKVSATIDQIVIMYTGTTFATENNNFELAVANLTTAFIDANNVKTNGVSIIGVNEAEWTQSGFTEVNTHASYRNFVKKDGEYEYSILMTIDTTGGLVKQTVVNDCVIALRPQMNYAANAVPIA